MKSFEYRIGWSAGSDADFKGYTPWTEWGEAADKQEVLWNLQGEDQLCSGLEYAIEESGFGWWAEVREMSS